MGVMLFTFNFRASNSSTNQSSLSKRNSTIHGIRVEESSNPVDMGEAANGVLSVKMDTDVRIRLFGIGLHQDLKIAFTTSEAEKGHSCKLFDTTSSFNVRIHQCLHIL